MIRFQFHRLLVFPLYILLIVGCSGGDGIDGTGADTVSGTAAEGKPLADAIIVLKDVTGRKKETRTASDGKYTFDVEGMTPPFFIRADVDENSKFFSYAPGKGVANVHQYSDAAVRNWFFHRNRDIELEFEEDSEIRAFGRQQLTKVDQAILNPLCAGISSRNLKFLRTLLISSPFCAIYFSLIGPKRLVAA